MNNQNYYRALALDEFRGYESAGFVMRGRDWTALDLHQSKEYRFNWLVIMVDTPKSLGARLIMEKRKNLIVKASQIPRQWFILSNRITPKVYININEIPFDTLKVVYDPGARISKKPVLLSKELIPELDEFMR